jgi:hypothetical protein
MARGGKRVGAGRKPGAVSKSSEEARRKAAETGETPMEYMLRVMRDPTVDHDRRDKMAQAAAPYVHAKLQTTTVTGPDGVNVVVEIRRFAEVDDPLAALRR